MVNSLLTATLTSATVVAAAAEQAQQHEPLLMRLSPQHRAIVIMALLALVLVGGALVALAVIGGRHVLRIARKSHGPTPSYEDRWYRKPLYPREPDAPSRERR